MQLDQICAIAVMAKAPRAGQVKTRLVPPLEPDGARAMSAAFLRDITENLALAGHDVAIHPFVAYAPAGAEALFDGLLAPGTRLVLADGTPDMPADVLGFGRCLLHATQSLLDQGYHSACVLNADSPTLPTQLLRDAARALAGPDPRAVLGPADDGGYYLLGMNRLVPRLYAEIAWSTATVAEQTRARAREAGIALSELPSWYDVDDRAALERLLRDLSVPAGSGLTPYAAPATAACVERLGIAKLLAS